jgi:DNA-binding NarL/FixJ family response regulator
MIGTSPRGGGGMSPREQEIMERHDGGMVPSDIARELGLGFDYVRKIVSLYTVSGRDRAFKRMMRLGSTALRLAIEDARRAA